MYLQKVPDLIWPKENASLCYNVKQCEYVQSAVRNYCFRLVKNVFTFSRILTKFMLLYTLIGVLLKEPVFKSLDFENISGFY